MNALESAIDTSTVAGQYEAKYLADYKENIVRLNELQEHLEEVNGELKELSFAKEKRDMARLRALKDERIGTQNRIGIYEKKLKRLEASKPLRDLFEYKNLDHLDAQLGGLKEKAEVTQYHFAESVNDWWEARGYKSPYKEKTVVQNITLTEDTKFVRVYDGVNSFLEGGWVMRAEDIKGLTPKEIQVRFALEFAPKFIGEVELKAGDAIRLGEVGPNFGFAGGGIQIDLQQQWIGDFVELGEIEDWR